MKSVFLSYSTKRTSEEFVTQVSWALERVGFGVVTPHAVFSASSIDLPVLIRKASLLLALLEDTDSNVLFEIGCALGAGRPVLVVTSSIESLPFSLRNINTLKVDRFDSHAIGEIVRRLEDERIEDTPQSRSFVSYKDALRSYREDPEAFESIGPDEFERILFEWCNDQGWMPEIADASRDAGFDFTLRNFEGHGSTLVQTKKYSKSSKMSVTNVQALLGVMYAHQADCGILITSSDFTRSAADFAGKYSPQLRLWNIDKILERL